MNSARIAGPKVFLQRKVVMEQVRTRTRRKKSKPPQRALRAVLLIEDQTKIDDSWTITGIQKMDLGRVIWDFSTEAAFKRAKGRTIANELLPVFVEMINARSKDLSTCIVGCVDFPNWMNRAIPE